MLCDNCKKKTACMHITKIINGKKQELHLCEDCAREHGDMAFVMDSTFSVHDLLKGIFNNYFIDAGEHKAQLKCDRCGMSYSDFSRSGKLGCSACYATFSSRLEPLVRRIHGASAHTGKIPKRSGGVLELKQRLKRMRQELEKCVAKEEYEQAARLRDEIKALEKQLNSSI